jgi:hypothetical protein
MKTIKLTIIIASLLVVSILSSCSKDDSSSGTPNINNNSGYYFKCKINGTQIDFAKTQVGRATVNGVETLLIKATQASSGPDTSTKMVVTVKKTMLGWQGGISLGIDNGLDNGSFDYMMYDGKVYNTAKLTGSKKMTIGFTTLEYKATGKIEGIFSGTLQNSNGDTLAITEGKFYNLVEN